MVDKQEMATGNVEKYQGTGKIGSAAGGFMLWSFLGGAVSAVASLPLVKTLKSEEALAESFLALKGAKLAVLGTVAGLGISIYGAVRGWNKSAAGEQQFNSLKSQRDEANIRNEGLQTQVNGLNQEVGVHRKRFSESTESRVAHGSHASAAEADKANASMAEAAR